MPADLDRLSDHVTAGAKPPLPESVTQHHGVGGHGHCRVVAVGGRDEPFLRVEVAPDDGLHTENREKVGRDTRECDVLRISVARQSRIQDSVAECESLEQGCLFPVLRYVRCRHGHAVPARSRSAVPKEHETVGFFVGEGREHHGIHDCEDGRVGADTQRQRRDRGGSKTGAFSQRACCEVQIADDVLPEPRPGRLIQHAIPPP